jgi:uncharacterized protein (DUF1778 family)
MSSSTVETSVHKVRKMLGVRATAEERRVLAEAAAREHRSVSSFVLRAALEKAAGQPAKPRRSRAEVMALFKAAREEFRAANPEDRDPVAELIAERRAEAERE